MRGLTLPLESDSCRWCTFVPGVGHTPGCPCPSDEAVAIGERLNARPPKGYRDRYSVLGWAEIAQAVLDASDALDELFDDRVGRDD